MIHARKDYNEKGIEKIIPADEPVFVLRGQDALAPKVVNHWADLLEREGGDPKTVQAARDHAAKMKRWEPNKIPDSPADQLL